ncbi:MAG TPA: hypothetical protein VFM25_02800 [Verrucomicrobiae bacterium]|nr:hypothetical protein [Verrucomicrobiae bacterium]
MSLQNFLSSLFKFCSNSITVLFYLLLLIKWKLENSVTVSGLPRGKNQRASAKSNLKTQIGRNVPVSRADKFPEKSGWPHYQVKPRTNQRFQPSIKLGNQAQRWELE